MAEKQSPFEQLSQQKNPSLLEDFWRFVVESKKWWMLPILVVLGLMGLLATLTSTGAGPFIYTFF